MLFCSQYQGLFGATRIPKKGQDEIKRSEKSSHICVMRNGHFYAVNVLDNDGKISHHRLNHLDFEDIIHTFIASIH